ncbi:MAG: ABC transporter ATP-binding protein [Candidatus Parvarchaeota archaeon]
MESPITENQESGSLVDVKNLSVEYYSFGVYKRAISDISFNLNRGEVLGILGESGSGKSTIAWSIMGMIEPPHKISGTIEFEGKGNILKYSPKELQNYRWKKIAMVFQTTMNSFDPLAIVGKSFASLLIEKGIATNYKSARLQVIELFRQFNLPDTTYNLFPFELSGGMKQRISIAMSIACDPIVLIADEPTTALDTVSQFGVLLILKQIIQKRKVKGMIYITHDISVHFIMDDRVMVMLGGRIVEYGTKDEIYRDAKHPYTIYLLAQSMQDKYKVASISIKKNNQVKHQNMQGDSYCPFVNHCPFSMPRCTQSFPTASSISETHKVYCYIYG